jgi:hypothetical protein
MTQVEQSHSDTPGLHHEGEEHIATLTPPLSFLEAADKVEGGSPKNDPEQSYRVTDPNPATY